MKLLPRYQQDQYDLALADGWEPERLQDLFDCYENDKKVYPGLGIVIPALGLIFYKSTRQLTLWPTDVPTVAFCDGSGTTAGRPAGVGVAIYRPDRDPVYLAKNIGNGTNNIAELASIAICLQHFNLLKQEILIFTDSQYTINMLQLGYTATANYDLISKICLDLSLREGRVKFEHVYGHKGTEGNMVVDGLANIGRKHLEPSRIF